MGLPLILSLLWNYKFVILSILLIGVCSFQANTIKNERIEFSNKIKEIEISNLKQKHLLIEKARELERNLNSQISKNTEIKRDKDEQVDELNTVIYNNSSRLQQLTQRAIEADKRKCTNTSTTEIIERVVEVPTSKGSGELAAEMAEDFQRLSMSCASNYEKLKNEAEELEGWSEAVVENIEIK